MSGDVGVADGGNEWREVRSKDKRKSSGKRKTDPSSCSKTMLVPPSYRPPKPPWENILLPAVGGDQVLILRCENEFPRIPPNQKYCPFFLHRVGCKKGADCVFVHAERRRVLFDLGKLARFENICRKSRKECNNPFCPWFHVK